MKPGIDPRDDHVFKWLFGNEGRVRLALDLVNAVLELPPERKIRSLAYRNPHNDKETLEDKTTILDIRAQDETGRHYNIEMQMVGTPTLPHRLLYYWAQVHADLLKEGEQFEKLRPTISICFVNTVLFPEVPDYHLHFELRSARYPHLIYSDQQSMHLVQLPKLKTHVEELVGPMEAWCYFLIHGEELDTESLCDTLRAALVPEAMEALIMFSQDEIERARYLSRKMFRHDLATALDEATKKGEREGFEKGEREGFEKGEREGYEKGEREGYEKGEREGFEKGEFRGILRGRIQFCQRLLNEPQSTDENLARLANIELEALAEKLEKRLAQQK